MTTQAKRVAIVTGGGSGIGLAIAEKFTQAGIETIIVGRDENKLKQAKEKLGDHSYAMICDLSNLSSIPSFVCDVIKQFGQIDVLVNNAGINMKKEFQDVTAVSYTHLTL